MKGFVQMQQMHARKVLQQGMEDLKSYRSKRWENCVKEQTKRFKKQSFCAWFSNKPPETFSIEESIAYLNNDADSSFFGMDTYSTIMDCYYDHFQDMLSLQRALQQAGEYDMVLVPTGLLDNVEKVKSLLAKEESK